jgi:hypothetical protein
VLEWFLYISDINLGSSGQSFAVGEFLLYDGLTVNDSNRVLGSPVGADVISSAEYNSIGDILNTNSTTGRNLKYNVSKLLDSNLSKGYITFRIIDGGEGYTVNSNITLSYGTATSGVGANFKIGSISNPFTFLHNTTLILPYVGTAINSADYGPGLNNATANTILQDALTFQSVTVGTIASLTAITSGNKQYNGTLNVNVYEPISFGYGWIGTNGGIWGNNAIISATPSSGNGVIESVRILSSGYGYNKQGDLLDFINQSNTNLEANLSIIIDGVGTEEGYWKDESSFLNDNKFIQDSFYYQEYSYEIQVDKSLDKYIDVVKKLSHPVGNKVFGKPLIIDNAEASVEIVFEKLQNIDILQRNFGLVTTTGEYVLNRVWDISVVGPYIPAGIYTDVLVYNDPSEPGVWRYFETTIDVIFSPNALKTKDAIVPAYELIPITGPSDQKYINLESRILIASPPGTTIPPWGLRPIGQTNTGINN